MLLFTRSRFPLSSVVVAAGLIAAATALAADPVDVASLAEYIATICSPARGFCLIRALGNLCKSHGQ
jgi:hypothetical protein